MKPPVRRSYHTGPEAVRYFGLFGLFGSFALLSELLVLGGADAGLSTPASRLDGAPGAEVLEPMVLFGVVLVDDPVVAGLSVDVPVVGDFSLVSPLITPVLVSVLVPVPTVELPVAPVPDWPVVEPLTVPGEAPVRVSSLDVPVGPAEAPVAPVLPVVLVPVPVAPVCAKAPAAASAPAARILAA